VIECLKTFLIRNPKFFPFLTTQPHFSIFKLNNYVANHNRKFKDLGQFQKTILPNGIKILNETIPHVKSFSLGFWFNVGSRDEILENNGITHFIEHMLFKGTKNRSAKKIADDIESYGGYLNAFTSKEHTCYYGRGLAKQIDRTFDVLSDMIQYPTFKESEIKKEAAVVIDEMNDIEDNPEELIFDKFEELIYQGNTLGLPVIGKEQNLKRFHRLDLFNFIEQKYGFNNFTIAASGDINHTHLVNLSEKYLKKNLGKKRINRTYTNSDSSDEIRLDKEIQQIHVIIGKETYGYNDKKRTIVNVLSHILGEGSSSRLFQTVREKNGICYQINTFLNSFYDVSSFGVYFSTSEKYFEKSMNLVLSEFKKVRDKKVSVKELNRAKEYLKGSILLSLESTTNRMFRMAQSEIYYDRIKPVEEVIKEIEEVTVDDIIETANNILNENSLSKIILGSKNSIAETAA
jgi:predicted Zn-dependent peptidase